MLHHPFGHCAKFPTAASRRSLDRVSVPVWPCALSGRLTIVALVGHYPANKLIVRSPLLQHRCQFCSPGLMLQGLYAVLALLSQGYSPLKGRLATCYSPVRHFTQTTVLLLPSFLVRLACVRHAASVDSEPGSNSRLKLGLPLLPTARRPRSEENKFPFSRWPEEEMIRQKPEGECQTMSLKHLNRRCTLNSIVKEHVLRNPQALTFESTLPVETPRGRTLPSGQFPILRGSAHLVKLL